MGGALKASPLPCSKLAGVRELGGWEESPSCWTEAGETWYSCPLDLSPLNRVAMALGCGQQVTEA